MRLDIRVEAQRADEELRSLYAWLRAEDDLRGMVSLVGGKPSPGQMGALAEVLAVTLGSGGAAAVLVRSVTVWLQQRRSDTSVEITTSETERTVKVTAQRVADAEAIIRTVLDAQVDR